MALPLVHLKGSAGTPGFVKTHICQPGKIVYVSGAQIVIAGEDDRRQQQFLRAHDEPITAFAVSNAGQFIASGQSGRNADMLLWDANTGQCLTRFSEHDHAVLSLCFSHDDKLLLSIGSEKDQRLFVLDTSNGRIVTKHVLEFGKKVSASAFAPSTGDGYVFAVAFGADVVLWSLNPYTGMLSPRPVVAGSVRRHYTQLVFSPDGQWLYAGTTSGDIVTINVLRAAAQLTHPACSNGVGALALSSTGRLLVGGGDGSITILSNDHMWRDMRPFVTVPGAVTTISPTLDGAAIIVGTAEGGIWRVASGTFGIVPICQGPAAGVAALSANLSMPDIYATAGLDGRINIYNAQDQGLRQVLHVDPTAGLPLCMDLSGGLVVSGWADGAIRAHAVQPPAQGLVGPRCTTPAAWTLPGAHTFAHSCGTTALCVAGRGHLIASGGMGGEVRVWNARSREMVGHIKHHGNRVNQIAMLSDDTHLVAVCEDHSLSAIDMSTQKLRATWRRSTPIRALAACPDQVTLLTVGHEKHLTVWDLRLPDPVLTVNNAHDANLGAVAVSSMAPNLAATGGGDGLVKLWDLRLTADAVGCTPLATGTAHTGPVTSALFHPNGSLITAGQDGCVATWQP